jgi:hypothetical protein
VAAQAVAVAAQDKYKINYKKLPYIRELFLYFIIQFLCNNLQVICYN